MFRVAHSGLEPLPHLSNPGFNPFFNPFQRFFDFTPALKPPVEDNGDVAYAGCAWVLSEANPDLSIGV